MHNPKAFTLLAASWSEVPWGWKIFIGAQSAVAAYWVQLPAMTNTLCVLMFIDWATGFVAALRSDQIDSKRGFWGAVKKLAMLLVIVVSHEVSSPLKAHGDLGVLFAYFFLVNEFISILENAAKLDVPLPKGVLRRLRKARDLIGASENLPGPDGKIS